MDDLLYAAEQISLFCRLNINTKRALPVRSSEMGMLIYLCNTGEDKTPMGVARFFNVSKAMATNMVTALLKKGYLEKTPAPGDRRSALLIPSDKARQLVADTYSEYYKTMLLLQEMLGGEDFSALLGLLGRANQFLLEEKQNG